MDAIDKLFGISPAVLSLRSQRFELISANLANADTPGYKAVDIDFEPRNTLEQVREYLQQIRRDVPDAKAKINAWPQAPHIYVVRVLNIMMEEGFTDITYSGIPTDLMKRLTKGNFKK